MQMEYDGNDGSSNAGQPIALRIIADKQFQLMVLNMVEQQMKTMVISTIKPMVISIVRQEIEPAVENLLRRMVKEEIQAVEEKILTVGSRNHVPKGRSLQLKFIDEVSGPAQTGKELKGMKDDPLKVALVDAAGQIVTCGAESSAKVEIVLLDAGNDDENNLTHENFERKIIGEEDKEKPHFTRGVYTRLSNGVGELSDLIKLAHGKHWTRTCNCRLGVRMVQRFNGILVQEGWTAPFKVIDKRGKLYEKCAQPSPSSEIWRLQEIARNGNPCKGLENKNIKTVEDLLFWQSVDPLRLREISKFKEAHWKTIVAQANTCIIDDKKTYLYKSSTEAQVSVIYNRVGKLKGVIKECRFVPIDDLSDVEKDHACELLKEVLNGSAFEQRYKTEVSLVQGVPHGSCYINASTNSATQQCLNISDLTCCRNLGVHETTEPGSSSRSINPNYLHDLRPSDSLGSRDTGELREGSLGLFPDPKNMDGGTPTDLWSPSDQPNIYDTMPFVQSPNPMLQYLDDFLSDNANQMYGPGTDEGIAATAEPDQLAVETRVGPPDKKSKVG